MGKKEEQFNMSKWKKDLILEKDESLFNIDPKTAHKIWDLIIKELKWVDDESLQEGEINFSKKFATASMFFHFLNKNLK